MPSVLTLPTVSDYCVVCGNFLKGQQRKVCSRDCLQVYITRKSNLKKRGGEGEKTCPICGKTFRYKLYRSKRTYCSRRCAGKATCSIRPIGDCSVRNDGSVWIKVGKGKGSWKPRARFMMEQHLGRPLTKDEQVHHINGIKADDRLENFLLVSRNSHQILTTICASCSLRKENQLLRRRIEELEKRGGSYEFSSFSN